jgi:uncharacterized protein YndB with AHSA1/START domain
MSTPITVTAQLRTDIKKTWKYYTAPEHIVQWNFADPSWCCPSASNDLRPGGKYVARMEARDGSFGFDFEVVYDEIVEEKSLSYTMADGRKAKVEFSGSKSATQVTIQFDPENQNPVELQQNGWQSILNNFKQYAESR